MDDLIPCEDGLFYSEGVADLFLCEEGLFHSGGVADLFLCEDGLFYSGGIGWMTWFPVRMVYFIVRV